MMEATSPNAGTTTITLMLMTSSQQPCHHRRNFGREWSAWDMMYTPAAIHLFKALECQQFERMEFHHVKWEVLQPFLTQYDQHRWKTRKLMILPVFTSKLKTDWSLVHAAWR